MVRFEHEICYHALMVRRDDCEDDEISSVGSSDSSLSMRDFTQHVASPVTIATPTTGNQLRTPFDILRQVLHYSSLDDGENGSFFAAIGSATIVAVTASVNDR